MGDPIFFTFIQIFPQLAPFSPVTSLYIPVNTHLHPFLLYSNRYEIEQSPIKTSMQLRSSSFHNKRIPPVAPFAGSSFHPISIIFQRPWAMSAEVEFTLIFVGKLPQVYISSYNPLSPLLLVIIDSPNISRDDLSS